MRRSESNLAVYSSSQEGDLPIDTRKEKKSSAEDGENNAESSENLKERFEKLKEQAVEFIDGYDFDVFFSGISSEDFGKIRNILSAKAVGGSPRIRPIANVLLRKIPSEQVNSSGENNDVNKMLSSFGKSFVEAAGSALDFDLILGSNDWISMQTHMALVGWTDYRRNLFDLIVEDRFKGGTENKKQSQPADTETNPKPEEATEANPETQNHPKTPDHFPVEETGISLKIEEGKEVEGQFQEWINLNREKAYAGINAALERKDTEALKLWLLAVLNSNRSEKNLPELKIDLLEGVEYLYPASSSSAQIAGGEIKRPLITFPDSKSFNIFFAALEGIEVGHNTEGVIVGINTKDDIGMDEVVGLIFTSATEVGYHIAGHEMRHSIDPHVFERRGYDMIVTEAWALFHETVVEPWGSKKETQPFSDNSWDNLKSRLLLYYQMLSDQVPDGNKMTEEEYAQTIDSVVSKMKSLVDSMGPVEMQRWLIQQKELKDLI